MMNKTCERVQVLFLHALQDVQEIQKRGWRVLPTTRIVKEEQLGRCCYLAEEFLSPAELCALREEARLSERQWRVYKARLFRR
jgi:hypothetical protein